MKEADHAADPRSLAVVEHYSRAIEQVAIGLREELNWPIGLLSECAREQVFDILPTLKDATL